MATTTDGKLKVTAGFWARGVATLLARTDLKVADREKIIDDIRQLAQFAADNGAADLVTTDELKPGEQ